MIRKFLVPASIAFALILSGCNTVKGAGRDIQSAGEAIEDVAD